VRYDVTLHGCDDSTNLLDIELSDVELAAVQRLAELASKEGGGCSPTMSLGPSPEAPGLNAYCEYCFATLASGDEVRRYDREGWVHVKCLGSSR
jgi:hypothetical protein